jgi:hypothetical protein
LTFANGVSLLALFVALGGVGYAATALPENSVGTKQIKESAVTLPKIAAKAQRALRGRRGPKGAPCLATNPACRGPRGFAGPGATKLQWESDSSDNATPLGSVGPWTLSGRCEPVFDGEGAVLLNVQGPGAAEVEALRNVEDGPTPTVSTDGVGLLPGEEKKVVEVDRNSNSPGEQSYVRRFASVYLHGASHVALLQVHMFDDFRSSSHHCRIEGLAIPAG